MQNKWVIDECWVINTLLATPTWASAPAMGSRTDYMQIATRMATNWKENNEMAKNSTRDKQKLSNKHKTI